MTRGTDLPILPNPRRVAFHGGTVGRSLFRSVAFGGTLPRSAERHVRDFAQRNGLTLATEDRGPIVITLGPKEFTRPEGYALQIADRITLKTADPAGLFYGLQTLQQVFDIGEVIPRCRIGLHWLCGDSTSTSPVRSRRRNSSSSS